MAFLAEYRELRNLTLQAVSALGERRTALVADCSLTSIQTWMRRPQAHAMPKTIARCLPRMRQWNDWMPGYTAARAEVGELQNNTALSAEALAAEFTARLPDVADRWTLMQIAYACEVPVTHLRRWTVGVAPECERGEMIRAVAHLRHIDLWPEPQPADALTLAELVGAAAGSG
jgi:hypothetical protein